MNLRIENMMGVKRLWIIIIVTTLSMLGSLIYLYEDVTIPLYILTGVFAGLLLFFVDPFISLLLIILINHFDSLFDLPFSFTIGRIFGVIVAIGWFFKYFIFNKTNFFRFIEFNRIMLVLIVLMVVSSLLATYPTESIKMTLTILMLMLMAYFVQDFVNNNKKLNILIATIALSVGIASLVGIIQYKSFIGGAQIVGSSVNESGNERFAGFQTNPNGYGAFLMYGIPLLLFLVFNSENLLIKLFSMLFFFTSTVSLGLTLSRTHIIGFIVFISIYLFLNFKFEIITKKMMAILVLMTVVFSIILSYFLLDIVKSRANVTSEIRYDIMMKGVELLKENPFFGIGFENYQKMQDNNDKYNFLLGRPGHEIISKIFVSIGLTGSIVLIYLCYKTLKIMNLTLKRFRNQNDKYLLSTAIMLTSGFSAQLATCFGYDIILSRIFWIYIGLAVVLYGWSCSSATPKHS